jgi:hypothetical protein
MSNVRLHKYRVRMPLLKFIFFLLLSNVALDAGASEAIERAKTVFNAYVAGYHSFDANVVDLYADDALIQNKRTYPDGRIRELVLPAPQYKNLVRSAMPLVQSRGDRSQYNEPSFKEEARGVRITISRYSELKKYTSPMFLLIGPSAGGRWLVLEELTESIP